MAYWHFQARQQILDVWRAVAAYSMNHGAWRFGGSQERNSISDAEQLLCLLKPAAYVPTLRLEDPDSIADDVAEALLPLGDRVQIPRAIVHALDEYLQTYTDSNGAAIFSGAGCLVPLDPGTEPSAEQMQMDLTASFATSVHLCLAALGFVDVHAASGINDAWRAKVLEVRSGLGDRLTAALTGLLRGFVINTFEPESFEGRNLLQLLNQAGRNERRVVEHFHEVTLTVRSRLTEFRLGTRGAEPLHDPTRLFELGWTWGIAQDAPVIAFDEAGRHSQQLGVAESTPSLRATLLATDAISKLDAVRTQILRLLDPVQSRLAHSLVIRRDVTQLHWSRIARFGWGRWPLEDLPWLTVGGFESHYYSLLISALTAQDVRHRSRNSNTMRRLEPVLNELAQEARITRRALSSDPLVRLHMPGFTHELVGAERLGPALSLQSADFAAVLLKYGEYLAGMANETATCERLLKLGDAVWEHLRQRRIPAGAAAGLWDDPSGVYDGLEGRWEQPRWDLTCAIIDALVAADESGHATRRAAHPSPEAGKTAPVEDVEQASDDDGPEVPETLLHARSINDERATASGTRLRRLSL